LSRATNRYTTSPAATMSPMIESMVIYGAPLKSPYPLNNEPGNAEEYTDYAQEHDVHRSAFLSMITLKISGCC
jgi:hypothetical protein